MTTLRLWGVITALGALLADQALKQWLLFDFDIGSRQPVRLTSFLDIVLAWNRGISYSLFTTQTARGRLILLAVTLLATIALGVWLARTRKISTAIALGLLIGGALGNAYDRYAYGAVADFVQFHVGALSWYIFNGADVAITAGVIALIGEQLFTRTPGGASKLP